MRTMIWRSGVLGLLLALACAGAASADTTLGTTTQPAGSSTSSCNNSIAFGQTVNPTGISYAVPAPGGIVKQWSTNVTGATAGSDIYLLVLRGTSGSTTVVGVDHETVPATPPASGVATFTVAHPILAQAGDYLGLYSPSSSDICAWSGTTSGTVSVLANPGPQPLAGPPTTGQTLTSVTTGQAELNVSAVVGPAVSNLGVTASSVPARPTVGGLVLLSSKVVNRGPTPTAASFTDTVPKGLRIEGAAVAGGTCSVSGQQVACTTSSLAKGHSALVKVIVLAKKTGTYRNRVTVSSATGATDPHPANNSSTITVRVTKPGSTQCTVPQLKGTPAGVATHVLGLLGCKATVQLKNGNGVPRGTVLSTNPGPGVYALDRKITLIVRK